jgi:hypothetical protein
MTVATISRHVGRAEERTDTAARQATQDEGPPPASMGDVVMPWAISMTFHLGLALVGAFIFFAAHARLEQAQQSIIVPQSFEDPSYSEHPGGNPNAGAGDPLREAAQDRLKQMLKSEGWTNQHGTQDLTALVGNGGDNQALAILAGSGASIGKGKDSTNDSAAALYGGPSAGAGSGPRSSFYGTGGNATKIVYLIDHTGSLVELFGEYGDPGSIKDAVQHSVSALVPIQYFSIVVFTAPSDGGIQILAPLTKATPDNRKSMLQKFDQVVAQGGEGDTQQIFVNSFRAAFTLHPELIYFLTDGDVAKDVPSAVKKMNPDGIVKINVIMITPNSMARLDGEDNARFAILNDLAKDNGGNCKIISYGTDR